MKKKFITLLLLLSFSLILLVGCQNSTEDNIPIIVTVQSEFTINDQLSEGTLQTEINGVNISWQSSKPGLITTDGIIIKPQIDTTTSLTAIFTYEDKVMTKVFDVVILGNISVDYNIAQTMIDSIYFDEYQLIDDISLLPISENGFITTWESSNEEVISSSGIVTRPPENSGNAIVTITLTLSYNDITIKKDFIFTVFDLSQTVVYLGYYSGADNLMGEELKTFLHELIDDHNVLSYAALWDALAESDEDPNNPNNVILLYTGRSQLKSEIQSGNNNQDYWNREHVWPKAHGAFDTTDIEGTDMHHIRPTDVSVNAERGSLDFDYGGTVVYDGDIATLNLKDYNSFEPRDEVKGDIARMIFYMAVRYEGDNDELDLELTDLVTTTNTPFMGNLHILLEWNSNDPVDDFEMHRNDVIFTYQGNRNPFIDHPEFAQYIWGII